MKMKTRALPRLALMITVFALTTIGTSAASARPVAAPSGPTIFRDAGGSPVLAVELGAGRPDLGTFDFIVTGVGDYNGVAPIRQTGPRVFHIQATVPARLHAPNADPRTVSLRMEAELDPDHGSAAVNVWVGGTHYHLVTANGTEADAGLTARRALAALSAHDWTALYALMEPQVQINYTAAQFAHIMGDPSLPQVTAAKLNGKGTITRTLGYPIFTQPTTISARKPNGTMMTFASNMYLVLENRTWYVLSTDAPPGY